MIASEAIQAPAGVPKQTVRLLAGLLAVLMPPIMMGLATQSLAFAVGYVPLLLLWAGIPQLAYALVASTSVYERLPRSARVVTAPLVWLTVGAATGSVIPFYGAHHLRGAFLGAGIAVFLLGFSTLIATAALAPRARRLRIVLLGLLGLGLALATVLLVPHN